jgi:RNA polymerase sigma-70 factor (ECF subfamily)
VRLRLAKNVRGGPPRDEGPEVLCALSPEDLALRAARGSVASYSELVKRFEVRLFNFLLRKVSRTDAEDLAQETFVRAWERIGSYDRRWRFSTWLFTIASRLAVSHYRKRSAAAPRAEFAPDQGPGEADRDVEADCRLGRRLWALAASLGADQHEALWLRYAEDLSIPEIAEVMRKSHVGVRVCLFRARQALAGKLEAQNEEARNGESKEVSKGDAASVTPVVREPARGVVGLAGGVR